MAASPNTVACAVCGALNDGNFKSCIRCNQPLHQAESADQAVRRGPDPRRQARAGQGPGTEPLFGRFPAHQMPAARSILVLNMVVFATQLLSSFAQEPSLSTLINGGNSVDAIRHGALFLGRIGTMPFIHPILFQEPWRILSACYVHRGPIHIGMNMMALIYMARIAEPAIGSVRFMIAYTLTGIGGFFTTAAWFVVFGTSSIATAGASGAVFGIMGLILGILIRKRDPKWKDWLRRMVVVSLGIAFVLDYFLALSIDHTAHIGGLVVGVAIGLVFGNGSPAPSRGWHRAVASLCVLATMGVLIAARLSPYP